MYVINNRARNTQIEAPVQETPVPVQETCQFIIMRVLLIYHLYDVLCTMYLSQTFILLKGILSMKLLSLQTVV